VFCKSKESGYKEREQLALGIRESGGGLRLFKAMRYAYLIRYCSVCINALKVGKAFHSG